MSFTPCDYCGRVAHVLDADGKAWCGRSHFYEGQQADRNGPCPCGSFDKFKKCCMNKAPRVRVCRACGCTEKHACALPNGWRCRWVAPDLCSACTSQGLRNLPEGPKLMSPRAAEITGELGGGP